jgi:hypothetical protein
MPRSPSRDLSDRYKGMRGYFRTPDGIRRAKYALAVLALIAACAWAAADVAGPSHLAYAHTHGPLANPHAAFDNNCSACHADHSIKDLGVSAVFHTRERWHDLTCEKCHSGPTHHESLNEKGHKFDKLCSNCHHDHLGRLNSLVRLNDADCTKCHADLKDWFDAAKSKVKDKPYQNAVTGFVKDHPDFRSLDMTQKPRTLTFSHAVHMNPGAAYTPGGKEGMTPDRIRELNPKNPGIADIYTKPGQAGNTPVQLECASCHKLDSGVGTPDFDQTKTTLDRVNEPTKTLMPPRLAGAYFMPVNFEESCRACHPLRAPTGTSPVGDKELSIPGFDIPHRRQPTDLLPDLTAGYVKGMFGKDHTFLKEPVGPGGKLNSSPPAGNARTVGEEAERLAKVAEKLLFKADVDPSTGGVGCAKCHKTSGNIEGKGDDALRILPVLPRTVWFEHAKFNHAAHRGATCLSCHPGTAGKAIPLTEANKPEPVQILGIDSCKACHSPELTKVKLPDGTEATGGGIRHNCTDCHNYHHGDLPLQGRGSELRFPKDPRDIKDWLKGK